MSAFPLRTAALALTAAVGLAACTTPYGYNGVSVGVGTGYGDPYYGSGYGYGYGAGYPGYGYGAGYPGYGYGMGYPGYGYASYAPWGWYDDFYYPGSGYYVYDRYRRPIVWTDEQRRYWEARRKKGLTVDAFRRAIEAKQQNWSGFEAGPTATTQQVVASDGQSVRVERNRPARTERVRPVRTDRKRVDRPAQQEPKAQGAARSDSTARKAARIERQSTARAERAERQETRRNNRDD
jgi:hypothetical protein